MSNRQYGVAALLGLVTYLSVAFALIRFGLTNQSLLAFICGTLMIGGLVGGVLGFVLRGRAAFARGAVLAMVLMLVAYPLSFGPACWIAMRNDAGKHATAFRRFSNFYSPVSIAIIRGPRPVRDCAMWYLELGAPADAKVWREWDDGILWSKPGYSYTLLSLPPSK